MSAVAIIPARGGSRRIPQKNRRFFHNKPIIVYSIQTALDSGLFTFVAVSTDDPEIGDIAAAHGARVLMRDPAIARDEVGTQDVIAHVLHRNDSLFSGIDHVACIYAAAPMLTVDTLRALHSMVKHGRSAYAYTVCGWRDAAQCYFGQHEAFLHGYPLDHWSTGCLQIPAERYCDINLPEDWTRAEAMYAKLQGWQ